MTARSVLNYGVEIEGTRLTPLRPAVPATQGGASCFVYRCRCGTEKVLRKKNVGPQANKTRSCGCLRREQCASLMGANKYKPGRTPWNKGLKNPYDPDKPRKTTKGRPAWNKGHIKVKYPNGSFKYVKVSDKAIGSNNPWSKF